jgi:hypothetical protein
LGDNIVDEKDVHVDSEHLTLVDCGSKAFEFARLKLLDTSTVDEMLLANEVGAVTALLRTNKNTECFKSLTETQLTRALYQPRLLLHMKQPSRIQTMKINFRRSYCMRRVPNVTRLH